MATVTTAVTAAEWAQLVQDSSVSEIKHLFAEGRVTAAVANSCFHYADSCSGMSDDLTAVVRRPAVVYAVCSQNLELLRVLLVSEMVDVNMTGPADGVTAMFRAAGYSSAKSGPTLVMTAYRVDLAEELLEHPKIDVNKADDEGFSPLHMAAWCGNTTSASLLLARPELKIEAQERRSNGVRFTALQLCATNDPLPGRLADLEVVEVAAVGRLIRAESARRARVTRAARLYMLWQHVSGTATAATAATAALLGKGAFAFSPRCPSDVVPKILTYASGTVLDDEIRKQCRAVHQPPTVRRAAETAPAGRATSTSTTAENAAIVAFGSNAPNAATARRRRLAALAAGPVPQSLGALGEAVCARPPPSSATNTAFEAAPLAALSRRDLQLLLEQEKEKYRFLSLQLDLCGSSESSIRSGIVACQAVRLLRAATGGPRSTASAAADAMAPPLGGAAMSENARQLAVDMLLQGPSPMEPFPSREN